MIRKKSLAEQKFRPLKKQMQQTFKRIKQAMQEDTIPQKKDVDEFVSQITIMVSYPGFGDQSYPAIVAAGKTLAECSARRDLDGLKQSLAHIMALQKRCHNDIPNGLNF